MIRLGRAALVGAPGAPAYDPAARGASIVHIGPGAFHRAHQAVYTDDALAAAGGDWRIIGVSLRSTALADALAAQDGLFTLVERGPHGDSPRIVASLAGVHAATREPQAVMAALTDPATRIVTLSVTEKGYGIDRAAGDVDPGHPAIAADLSAPDRPCGAIGLVVAALKRRFAAGVAPFTVLCCDNLPANGVLLRTGVLGFARRTDPRLADRIAADVAFPSSMVDRITPAPTEETRALAERLTGRRDVAAVETEPFRQWVIEDRFPAGRPEWEAGGALSVADVAPFERMKLRMLNGAHSLIAYGGALCGHPYVRDAMADAPLAALVRRHFRAAAATLAPPPGLDPADYAVELERRFANPAMAHATRQIASDGTEKLPQRIGEPALETLRAGGDVRPFAFVLALWILYCQTTVTEGGAGALADPRAAALAEAASAAAGPAAAAGAFLGVPGVFDVALAEDAAFGGAVEDALERLHAMGAAPAIRAEAAA